MGGYGTMPVELLDVLEALEMEAEDGRQLADDHALLCLLQALALVAEKLVLRVQHLRRAALIPHVTSSVSCNYCEFHKLSRESVVPAAGSTRYVVSQL